MRARLWVALLVTGVVVGSACGSDDGLGTVTATPTPVTTPAPGTPGPGDLFAGPVRVAVGELALRAEVAATPAARQRGLMFREEMDADAGMLFLFPAPSQGGFWMKNTLIPLSIAYLTREEPQTYRIVSIMDMEPCEEDPCPPYNPGVSYDAALEANQGWFDRAGAEVGTVVLVEGDLPDRVL